jgi:hypothetical protein
LVNLTAGANFQNGLLTIKQITWGALDTPTPTQTIGYLSIQADISASGATTILGGSTRTFPKINDDPRTGVKIFMQMDSVTGLVKDCGLDTTTEYFKFTFNTTSNSNTTSMYVYQMLPTAYADANYYVICSVTDPWAVNHDARGEAFGFIYPYNLTASGFNFRYLQQIGDWIPVGYALTMNCVTSHK